jgi:hypothetical protein
MLGYSIFWLSQSHSPLLYSSSYLYRLLPRRGDGHEKTTTTGLLQPRKEATTTKGNDKKSCGQEDICPEKEATATEKRPLLRSSKPGTTCRVWIYITCCATSFGVWELRVESRWIIGRLVHQSILGTSMWSTKYALANH